MIFLSLWQYYGKFSKYGYYVFQVHLSKRISVPRGREHRWYNFKFKFDENWNFIFSFNDSLKKGSGMVDNGFSFLYGGKNFMDVDSH